MTERPVYLVFGPQGSGKSTQAQFLADYLKLPFFDSGTELRNIVDSGKTNGQEIRAIMKSGKLVPNTYLKTIFDDYLANHNCAQGLVIDGFPRNMVQVKLFEELVNEHNWQVVAFYVYISDTTAKERLLARYTIVNGRKVVREDDQPAVVEKRLRVFKKETMPVINWLRNRHIVIDIDGEPERNRVFEQIKAKLNG